MANVGLKLATIALLDDNGKIVADADKGLSANGLLAIDHSMLGSTQANITNLEGAVVVVPGNNDLQDSYTQPAKPSIALTVNNMPGDVKNKITGYTSDGKGGYVYSGSKPKVALLVETQTLDRKYSVYFAFGSCIVSAASQNIKSDTDTTINREADALTFTALTVDRWEEPYKNFLASDTGFDEKAMLADVFNGYTATTGGTTTGGSGSGQG
jgi:hypothetical protein